MTIQRTDIHRPSVINPEEYQYLGIHFDPQYEDVIGGASLLADEARAIRGFMEKHGARWASHAHGGTCYCCGAHAVYLAVFYHQPSNECIMVGETCADKMEMGESLAFRAARKAVKGYKEAIAGRRKAQATLEALGCPLAWELYTNTPVRCEREEDIVVEMVSKLVRYGSISEKQEEFLRNLLYRIQNREAIKAEREAEKAAAKDCPEGRMVITGTVLTTKFCDNAFGGSLKMLVKTQDGYTVWGTVPSALEAKRGDTVTFKATVKPSDRDPKHGYFSRPSAQKVSQL